jgi:hypothetical protein
MLCFDYVLEKVIDQEWRDMFVEALQKSDAMATQLIEEEEESKLASKSNSKKSRKAKKAERARMYPMPIPWVNIIPCGPPNPIV